MDSANRTLLVLGTSSLFAADVSYHKSLSVVPGGKEKYKTVTQQKLPCTTKILYIDNLTVFHIIDRRSTDLKNKLKEKFKQKLNFWKPTLFSLINASEIAMSTEDPVLQEGGIQENLLIKNCPKSVSDEIQDRLSGQERQWPSSIWGEEYE